MRGATNFLAAALVFASLVVPGAATAQVDCNEGLKPLDRDAGSRMGAVDFIREVAANEVAYGQAFGGYTYTTEVTVQTVQGDTVDGQFHQISYIDYDPKGARRETMVEGPTNTMSRAQLGDKDIEALRDSFTLTPALLAERDIVYAGRQQVGSINAAAFDILPRNGQATTRRFNGRVWVRVSESAIFRICGRVGSGPFGPLRYLVERTRVGDHAWFPGTIRADEDAPMGGDKKVHVRVTVKYTDYKPR
jgi:hypothetical protein